MGFRCLQQDRQIEQTREVMRVRIANIDSKRIPPLLLQKRRQSTLDFSESVIPAHAQPPVILAHHWLANAIRVGMQLLEAVCFGTDVSMAEYILSISPDGENLTTTRLDL